MSTNTTPEQTNIKDVAIGDGLPAPDAPKARQIRYSVGSGSHSTEWHVSPATTFQAFYERHFANAKPATKDKGDLPAWCAGHVNGRRTKAHATGSDMLVVEYDQHELGPRDPNTKDRPKFLLPAERRTSMADALARWDGIERFLVTSYSHTPEIPRFRVVLALSRGVTPGEFDRLIHWAFDKLNGAGDTIDEQCLDLTRLWFAPCIPPSGHYFHQFVIGRPLDVDSILKEIPIPTPKKNESNFESNSRLGERIDEIKSKLDFEDLLRKDGIPFVTKGSRRVYNLRGERTPSGVYYDEDDHIFDFGTSEVWDVISYYRSRHAGDDFKRAIDELSERAGLPAFPWKLAGKPRKVDPLPVIEALPSALPATGRIEILAPALRAIATQDPLDQRAFVEALLAKYPEQITRRDITRSLRGLDDDDQDGDSNDGTYELRDGAIHYDDERLVNGNVEVIEAVRHDDGAETRDYFRIRATTESGKVLPEFEVPMTDFDQMSWLTPKTFGNLRVEPGKATRDRLRHAILSRSSFSQSTTYGDFGWRKIDGKDAFVHAGGAIGLDTQIRVEPPSEKLRRFDLTKVEPRKGQTEQKALQLAIWESLDFLKVAKAEITHPLYASIWHAPVLDVLPHRSAVTLIGETGTFKSSLSFEAQRHFGVGFLTIRDFIANFESTATAMEIMGHSLHNMLLVVDDAWPKAGRDGERQRDLCRKMIHTYANNAPRERATPDVRLRASREIRSVLWLTAESDLASASEGSSTSNRALKILVERGDIDPKKLAHLQTSKNPQMVTRAYIEWLAANPIWKTTLPNRHREILFELRALVAKGQIQARQPEVLASLIVSMGSFLGFCVAVDAITQDSADKHLAETRAALISVACEQTEISRATSPVARYMRLVKAALNTGRARIRLPERQLESVPGCADIGWGEANGTHVHLQPEALHSLLVSMDSEKSGIAPLRDIYQQMITELGATPPTASEKGRTGVKRAVGGTKQRVIEIPIEHFDGVMIPDRDALPSTDDANKTNDEVAPYLDPLWARVSPHGEDRVLLSPIDRADLGVAEFGMPYSEFVVKYKVESDVVAMIEENGGYLPIPRAVH